MTAGWACSQESEQHGAAAALLSTGHCSLCTLVLRHRPEWNPPAWGLSVPWRLACLRPPGYCVPYGVAGSHATAVPVTSSTPLETVGPPCSDHQETAQEPFWSHRYGLCTPRAWEQRRILSQWVPSATDLPLCLPLPS